MSLAGAVAADAHAAAAAVSEETSLAYAPAVGEALPHVQVVVFGTYCSGFGAGLMELQN